MVAIVSLLQPSTASDGFHSNCHWPKYLERQRQIPTIRFFEIPFKKALEKNLRRTCFQTSFRYTLPNKLASDVPLDLALMLNEFLATCLQ